MGTQVRVGKDAIMGCGEYGIFLHDGLVAHL
jgi:hypothetical protein